MSWGREVEERGATLLFEGGMIMGEDCKNKDMMIVDNMWVGCS